MNPLSWFDSELIGTGPYRLVNRDLRAGTFLIEAVNPVHEGKYRQSFSCLFPIRSNVWC